MEPARVDDWSGGITDKYLNGAMNRARRLDNFVVSRNRKIEQRYGSAIESATYYRIPAGQQRIAKIFQADTVVMRTSARNLYYLGGSGFTTILGPVSSNPCFGAGTTANQVAVAKWQKHWLLTIDEFSTPRALYKDGSSVWQIRTLGLPELASTPSAALTAGGAALAYVYGFCHKYSYTVGTVTHTWRGPVTLLSVTSAAATAIAGGAACAITSIPVLANGSTECYATSTIEIEVYRTSNGGSELRLVGSVTNGTTTYNDTTTDAALTGIRVYTTGGVYDNDPPPKAKYVEVVNGVPWWGNVKEGSEEKPFRLRQGLVNQPYSAPSDLVVDLDSDCTGLSSVDVYLLAFERNQLWRIEGAVDRLGNGVVRKRIVSRTVGTVSHNSIVKTSKGCFFAAVDGFYFTDGFSVLKLSEHINASYRELVQTTTQESRINGVEDPLTKRVYWAAMSDSTATDCDVMYVVDPHWGLSEESTFTTYSGGEGVTDWYATSMIYIGEQLWRADNRGHVFYHDAAIYTDPVIDTGVAANLWHTRAVRYDYVSCAWAFGDEVNKKYAPTIYMVAKNETNVSLQIFSINNDSATESPLKEIRFRNNFVWGDDDVIWGDPSLVWNYSGTIVAERHFPSGSMRFLYKQIRMTNSETVIARSDDDGLATMAGAGNTALLLDNTRTWPTGVEGFNFYTEADDYDEAFPITTRTNDTLTVTDANGTFPTGDYAWLLKGYRKGERLSLESYTIEFLKHGESTPGYQRGEDGQNA